MIRIEFESVLGQFLAGTFNMDWTLDYGTTDAAVDSYASESHQQYVTQLDTELRNFLMLAKPHSEDEVDECVERACEYVLGSEITGERARAWLQRISARLEGRLKSPAA